MPFDPPNNSKNQNFEKICKAPRDIITLHLCTTNNDHVVYGFWFSLYIYIYIYIYINIYICDFGLFFPFNFLATWKMKILKKWKNYLEVFYFTHVHHKWKSYAVFFLTYGVRQTECFVILGHFLLFYLTNNPKNQNFEKVKKNYWRF